MEESVLMTFHEGHQARIYPESITLEAVKSYMEYLRTGTRHRIDLIEKSVDKIPGKTLEEKLKHCNDCNCCIRHQHLKPDKLKFQTDWEEEAKPLWVYNTCPCDCRHMARFICRQCVG